MTNSTISCKSLKSGEKIAFSSIKIDSIPHSTIIDERKEMATDVISRFKSDMVNLLNEIYQAYKSFSVAARRSRDISVELLWATEAVVNQPYKAKINLYINVRAIGNTEEDASGLTSSILKLFENTLTLQRYEFESVSTEKIAKVISNISDNAIRAIVKEESAENLQNAVFPCCYSYDLLPFSENDLSRVANILIDHPNTAVSYQLIPTTFSQEEAEEIDRVSQMLDVLSKGVADAGVGHLSFVAAEKQNEIYKYYSQRKRTPLFLYNVVIFAEQNEIASIASGVFGQLATGDGYTANLKYVTLSSAQVRKDVAFFVLPWILNERIMSAERNMVVWNSGSFSNAYARLPYIITADEACGFFRLPVGCDAVNAGFKVNQSDKTSKTYGSNLINAGDITVGLLRASSKGDSIGISLKDLAKHMLVVGTPGSGKTTFSVSLLDRLWKEHHIPFLVIEPAKNEYRSLVQSIPDLQVFTPGKNFISPFVFNPFIPPKNVKLETYKSTLKTAFAAAVSMATPLDKIFEESINNCYSDFRWLDTYTTDDKGEIFNIADFIKCFQETFEEIGYTGDAKNIGRAGVVRLNGLANLFDNYYSILIEDILQKPTIIELAAIENADQKALIISLLLLSILAYVNANYVGEGGLKNVILLEEAHVLLDSQSGSGQQGEADPSAIAQGLVKRMLAEIRSYGVGLVIADQSPRKVGTDVVALTDMKMVFRLVESEDKKIIGDSTNMTDTQVQRMARLKPGEAFLFFNKLEEPEEVITPDYRLENNISISLSDDGIRELSTYWLDKGDRLRPYPQCSYCRYCTHSCDYNRRILEREVARRIYKNNFRPDSSDFNVLLKVFARISKFVRAELNDEPFSPELLTCTKVHLWRKLLYNTKLPIKEIQIENSIRK